MRGCCYSATFGPLAGEAASISTSRFRASLLSARAKIATARYYADPAEALKAVGLSE